MNATKQLTIALAVAALALGLAAAPAHAQQVLKGSFELPAAVYWGDTLLQPGQYTIWMSTEAHDVSRVPVVHVSGDGVNITVLAISRPDRESGRNVLEIAEIGGAHVVRAFDAGMLGESFSFGVSKRVNSKALRSSNEPMTTVAVAAGY